MDSPVRSFVYMRFLFNAYAYTHIHCAWFNVHIYIYKWLCKWQWSNNGIATTNVDDEMSKINKRYSVLLEEEQLHGFEASIDAGICNVYVYRRARLILLFFFCKAIIIKVKIPRQDNLLHWLLLCTVFYRAVHNILANWKKSQQKYAGYWWPVGGMKNNPNRIKFTYIILYIAIVRSFSFATGQSPVDFANCKLGSLM